MRIISDFKDYYDSALSFGSDPNLTYVRKEEQFEFEARFTEKKNHMPRNLDQALRFPLEFVRQLPHSIRDRKSYQRGKLEIPITTKVVGFCGFLYAAIEIDGTTYYAPDQIASHLSSEFLWQFNIDQKGLENLLVQKWRNPWGGYDSWYPKPLTYDLWEKTLADFVGKRFDDVFIGLGVPAFKLEYVAWNKHGIIDKIRCTLNPYLRADLFQKIKPPVEAFQEISMYLGNQLARQIDPTSIVPDEILRDEKGFDEWSFRRHKEEDKKYRKKRNAD